MEEILSPQEKARLLLAARRPVVVPQANRDKVYAYLLVMFAEGKIKSWPQFRKWSEWLGCYTYVIPAERCFSIAIYNELLKLIPPIDSSDVYHCWEVTRTIQDNFNRRQQLVLLDTLVEITNNG